ncbi:hypothetical protein ACG3SL_21240 (plasmid) [Sphingomonas sp. CJ20]
MNRRQLLSGASAVTASVTTGALKVEAASFGAMGNGVADDARAIQDALEHVGKNGGGVVTLRQPEVHYRICRGLKLPSNVALEGPASVQYPFNAGNNGACALVADFTDINQWVIEPMTTLNGRVFACDRLVAGALPDGVTYNCGVRNLLVTSKGRIPFGGIRMHGCPGGMVEGVSIDRVGCGLLVNYSFGGTYRVQVHSLYYGVAAWDDANANTFQIYCSQSEPWPKTVPVEYRLPFMAQISGHFADTLKLSADTHGNRPYGVLCGSIRSTSISNVFDAVVERFPGGIFLFNAYATDFRRCYLEADPDVMACAIAASRSRFSIHALHAYLSGTGAIFDFGIDVFARIFASGILHGAGFGKAPVDDGTSLLLLEGFDPRMPDAPIQRNIRYIGRSAPWEPLRLLSGWRPAADGYEAPAVRLDPETHRVELKGAMVGGREGACFHLPPRCCPPARQRHRIAGGQLDIAPDGAAQIMPDTPLISLDGASFARW